MATLLSYKSRRTPAQNALIAFIVLLLSFYAFGMLPTQWFAAQYQYDANLGTPVLRVSKVGFYLPTDWVRWGLRLGDVESIKPNVHKMLMLGLVSLLLAIGFAIFVAIRLAKYTGGMDGLHGTARFAERADIDKTGFMDARGHKATGARFQERADDFAGSRQPLLRGGL